MSDSVRPHRRQPTRLRRPWDSPGKNTGVGCHFLLQSMKVKSESEVAQSCPTPSDPMDCSLPGSSVHGISQARVLEWGAIAFSKAARSTLSVSSTGRAQVFAYFISINNKYVNPCLEKGNYPQPGTMSIHTYTHTHHRCLDKSWAKLDHSDTPFSEI